MSQHYINVAVVIAAYNEVLNIGPLTERLLDVLGNDPIIKTWTLIYVVEGSDGTADIVRSFIAKNNGIRLDYNEKPSGLGASFRRGFDLVPADTNFVITLDADLNHQPEEIPRLLSAAIAKQADIVVGSRRTATSTIEDAPLWKTAISRTVNRLMQALTGARIMDMTSGFRVYRSEVLRALKYKNDGFAFLPEILIAAGSRGMRIVEEPIRFIFRKAGESKMAISATSLSYIKLLAHHSFGSLLAVGLLLLAGVLLRFLFCFPEHKPLGDSDSVLAGLCAFEIGDGKFPLFFPGGTRLGPFSCYATAGMFTLFGPNRLAVGATSVLFGTVFLIFMYLALSEGGGRKAALIALPVIVLPPLEFWLATYPTWGYIETMALSAAVLWLGIRLLMRPADSPLIPLLYGVFTGLALWSSVQSLMISGPMAVMLLIRRRLSFQSASCAGLAILTGTVPYLIVLLRGGLAAFSASYATRPAASLDQVASNFVYFSTVTVPWLLFSQAGATNFFSSQKAMAQALVLIGTVVTLLVILLKRRSVVPRSHVDVIWLLILVFLFSAGLFSVSSAGSFRGWTVRYAIPVYLAIPFIFLMLYVRVISAPGRFIVALGAGILGVLNCLDYPIFDGTKRQQEVKFDEQRAAIKWLYNTKRDAVIGDYFTVYSINFDSQRHIRALPTHPEHDYFSFGDRLKKADLNIALLERDPERLRQWMQNSDLTGEIDRLSPDLFAALIDKPVHRALVNDVQRAAFESKAQFSSVPPPPLTLPGSLNANTIVAHCYLDQINGMASTPHVTVDGRSGLRLVGWIADIKNGVAPEQVIIQLRSDQVTLYAPAQNLFERQDVATSFNNKAILKSGFVLQSSGEAVPPDKYHLSILQVSHGDVHSCEAVFNIRVR